MSESGVVVKAIDWRALFPALFLFRGMRIAFRPTLIAVGAIGIALSCSGWWIGEKLFLGRESQLHHEADQLQSPLGVGVARGGVIERFANRFYLPAKHLFHPGQGIKETAFLIFGLLWQLAVWSVAGGVITRQALVELATDENPGLTAAWEFVRTRVLFFVGAPLFPLLGVGLLALPLMFLGLFMRTDIGVFFAGIVWLFVAGVGLLAAWLLVGLALGWPLLWGGVAAEPDGDHFGAMSRMYSYVYQRPLNYLLYLAVVVVVGFGAGWLIETFAETAINTTHWGTSWGMSAERSAAILREISPGTGRNGGFFGNGINLIRGIDNIVRSLAAGLGASYFWCSFAGIYLLLRKDVDNKELDDILIPHDDIRPGPVETAPTPPPAATPTRTQRFEPGTPPEENSQAGTKPPEIDPPTRLGEE